MIRLTLTIAVLAALSGCIVCPAVPFGGQHTCYADRAHLADNR